MILTKEQFIKTINDRIGESTADEDLKFLEDLTDTYNSLVSSSKPDDTDWKKKYEDNDKEWRKKYRERFFSGDDESDTKPPKDTEPSKDTEPEKDDTTVNFDDVFTWK